MGDLAELARRVEEATGADARLDAEIAAWFAKATVLPYPPSDDFGPHDRWQFWSRDGEHFLGSEHKIGVKAWTATVAALYVEAGGCYSDLAGIEPWDEARDARLYAGPHGVVAHPPCQRWGRFWHGSTRKPHQFSLGDDGGCFAAALAAVRRFGGVLEHPADSRAWQAFGLVAPPREGGWIRAESLWDDHGGWTCYVEQGFYGHASRKPTWLYAAGVELPELRWGCGEQRIPQWMLDRYGYEKARRIGVVAMIGGKNKTIIRNATPPEFRDLLLSIARTTRRRVKPLAIALPVDTAGAIA